MECGEHVVGKPLPTVWRLVDQALIDEYADVSGDHNPLHTDPDFAAGTHYKGTIAHGQLCFSYIVQALLLAFGASFAYGGDVSVTFLSPVRPGDHVRASGAIREVASTGGKCSLRCDVVADVDDRVILRGEASLMHDLP